MRVGHWTWAGPGGFGPKPFLPRVCALWARPVHCALDSLLRLTDSQPSRSRRPGDGTRAWVSLGSERRSRRPRVPVSYAIWPEKFSGLIPLCPCTNTWGAEEDDARRDDEKVVCRVRVTGEENQHKGDSSAAMLVAGLTALAECNHQRRRGRRGGREAVRVFPGNPHPFMGTGRKLLIQEGRNPHHSRVPSHHLPSKGVCMVPCAHTSRRGYLCTHVLRVRSRGIICAPAS